ncbi:hypothetical protein I350_08313 [Cryptococcus amylolentus CBS 6273]|uniref:Zn(2)-C6 fungal-type domain-containing protein n=1 Tax=Cryptococcus amylolentus CBS 6273 TaxID=1296118 RepID=A0A1E3J609_9TREE|nr:hypothetical protein I350_08313 [Cryptococcus amylolentus CBS 6273]
MAPIPKSGELSHKKASAGRSGKKKRSRGSAGGGSPTKKRKPPRRTRQTLGCGPCRDSRRKCAGGSLFEADCEECRKHGKDCVWEPPPDGWQPSTRVKLEAMVKEGRVSKDVLDMKGENQIAAEKAETEAAGGREDGEENVEDDGEDDGHEDGQGDNRDGGHDEKDAGEDKEDEEYGQEGGSEDGEGEEYFEEEDEGHEIGETHLQPASDDIDFRLPPLGHDSAPQRPPPPYAFGYQPQTLPPARPTPPARNLSLFPESPSPLAGLLYNHQGLHLPVTRVSYPIPYGHALGRQPPRMMPTQQASISYQHAHRELFRRRNSGNILFTPEYHFDDALSQFGGPSHMTSSSAPMSA